MVSDKNKKILLVVEEGMILLETGVETEGSFALFASVLSLPSVTCCCVTADMAIWTSSIWYQFRERSTFEAKRKARILSSAANFTSLVSLQQPFCHCSSELKLSKLVVGASVVQDVCIDKCCIQDVEEHSFSPLDGTVCKTVI